MTLFVFNTRPLAKKEYLDLEKAMQICGAPLIGFWSLGSSRPEFPVLGRRKIDAEDLEW